MTPRGRSEAEARRAICRVGRELHASALIGGRAGNLSVRLDDGRLLVTPRGGHKGLLEPDDLITIPLAGGDAEAEERATSELPFHRAVYRSRPDVRSVVHTHAPALLAAGLREIDVTAPFPEIEEAMGTIGHVPFEPSGSESLASAVGEAAARADVLVLHRHGVLAMGATPDVARDRTELAELTAWAAILAKDAGLGLDLSRVRDLHARCARPRWSTTGEEGD